MEIVRNQNMYAMVEIKGKQYKAEKDALLKVDKLAEEAGKKVEFDSVLLVGSEGDVKIGTPYVKGAKVSAEVVEHGKDKKVVVFKYRRRKDSMSKRGHRQQYSIIKVTGVNAAAKAAAKKPAEKKTAEKKTEE
jgi:large subunit ribosomal protein L21